jgi:hypothetical protein
MSGSSAPDPAGALSWPEFGRLLTALYEVSGRPSFRQMQARGKRAGHPISASTAQTLAAGGAGRPQRRSIEGFLHGCGLSQPAHAAWLTVWDRLSAPGDPPPSRPVGSVDPVAALTSALAVAVNSSAALLGGAERTADPDDLAPVGAYCARIARSLDPGEFERLLAYLAAPDFGQLLPQIAVLWSPVYLPDGVTAALRAQLLHGLRLAVGVKGTQAERLTDDVVELLRDGHIRQVFRGVKLSNILAALGEATAKANARLLAGTASLAPTRHVAERMRAQVAALHREIRLSHTGQHRSVPWAELYVRPRVDVVRVNETLAEPDRNAGLDPREFVHPMRRTVVLGDPGAGKSTLAAKLAHDVATDTGTVGAHRVPFLAVLRDLSRALEHGERSLVDHLVTVCKEPYHVDTTPDMVEYLLLNGRAVVLLDGLDELTDVALRWRVVRLVEGFAAAYPLVPIVVTSRRIGYLDAPLSGRVFDTCAIASFDSDQVAAYANRWFNLDEGTAPDARATLAAAFLEESRSIDDLRRNPLLLSLLCAMYAAEHFIPRNRAQVYERCALMVFERWDRMRKGLTILMQFEGEVRSAVQRLAWHLLNGSGASEVPRSVILRLLVDHLTAKRYDEDEAARMANEFLEFCAGRAWVLAELGVVGVEPVYGFAHRTFLEYFAAEHLVRHNPLPEQVWALLADRIGSASWEVVGQLAMQLLDRNLDAGADRLLSTALDSIGELDAERRSAVLSFAARALQHVTPSPPVVTRIVDDVIGHSLALPLSERIVPWFEQRRRQRTVQMMDLPLHTLVDRPLDTNERSLSRAFVKRLAAEAAADNEVALLLTEQLSRPSGSLVGGLAREVMRASSDAFDRWRERTPWHTLWSRERDARAYVEICDRFGPAPLYDAALRFGWSGSPFWLGLFTGGEWEPPSCHPLLSAMLHAPVPWAPSPAPGDPPPILDSLHCIWPADGLNDATFVTLALPHLESATWPETAQPFRLHALLRALKSARTAHADARTASRRTRHASSEQTRTAQELRKAITEAELPDDVAVFLLAWARNEVSVAGS